MPAIVATKRARRCQALTVTPAGAGMNHNATPIATHVSNGFILAPHLNSAGAGVSGAGDAAGVAGVAAALTERGKRLAGREGRDEAPKETDRPESEPQVDRRGAATNLTVAVETRNEETPRAVAGPLATEMALVFIVDAIRHKASAVAVDRNSWQPQATSGCKSEVL